MLHLVDVQQRPLVTAGLTRTLDPAGIPGERVIGNGRGQDGVEEGIGLPGGRRAGGRARLGVPPPHRGRGDPVERQASERGEHPAVERVLVGLAGSHGEGTTSNGPLGQPRLAVLAERDAAAQGVEPHAAAHVDLHRSQEACRVGLGGERAGC
jgi:hypothetical protein